MKTSIKNIHKQVWNPTYVAELKQYCKEEWAKIPASDRSSIIEVH